MARVSTETGETSKLGVVGLAISFLLGFVVGGTNFLVSILLGLGLAILYLTRSAKIILEKDRAALFKLGKFVTVLGPGFHLILPGIENIQRVSLENQFANVPLQKIVSKDNIPLNTNAELYYRVIDAKKAVIGIENYQFATLQIARTVLRNVIAEFEMDEVLQQRDVISHKVQEIIDSHAHNWGVKIIQVEIMFQKPTKAEVEREIHEREIADQWMSDAAIDENIVLDSSENLHEQTPASKEQADTVVFCTNCGVGNNATIQYCSFCGKELEFSS